MKIRTKYQLVTAALIILVVICIAAMVIHTQRKVLRGQSMQRLEVLMEGAARIAKESFVSRDRLMAVSYLMFLQKTYPELAFASVSHRGYVSRIGKETNSLLYLESNVPLSAGSVRDIVPSYSLGADATQHNLNISTGGISLQVSGEAAVNIEEDAAPASGVVRLGFVREIIDEQVNKALAPLIRRTAGIAGIFLLLGLIVNVWVTRLLTGPIEVLAQATSLLAIGRMKVSVPVRTNDELGTLTRNFNLMVERLNEQMESREDIMHTLTHEVNTPLSGLKGYLELWQDDKMPHDTKETREILCTMTAAVLRMENSLNNALMLFRGEESLRLKGGEETVIVNAIVEEAIVIFRPIAQANDVKILPFYEGSQECIIAPSELIRQIVTNLVSNAIKYTPRGGYVRMGLKGTDKEIIFHIRNTGYGIPAEDIPHLFTKFYRSIQDREKGNRISGTGLGLSIVHKAVSALGGRVWAVSQVNNHTSFFVRLPKRCKIG